MVPPVGPIPARYMIVGEAPGEREIARGIPFVGASGHVLDEMLAEAGIMRGECFITNVVRERPPNNDIDAWIPVRKSDISLDMIPLDGRMVKPCVREGYELLVKELAFAKPTVILALGNTPLWALANKTGVKKWRGSYLPIKAGLSSNATVLPAYHPAYILRDWSARQITVLDFKRARRLVEGEVSSPRYSFVCRPTFTQALDCLSHAQALCEAGPTTLSVDIETRGGQIACVGVATSCIDAWCIPFMCVERKHGYWSEHEEIEIIGRFKHLLTHPNARVIGQNFIYDAQYFWRQWHFVPRFVRDTMLGHHVCFAGLPKGLDFLSSMYAEWHVYWKDESKDWDPKVGEDQLWTYNCKDAVITYEVDREINASAEKLNLGGPQSFQNAMFWPVLQAMVRGVRVDTNRREALRRELLSGVHAREEWMRYVLEAEVNIRSPKQMASLFYETFAQKKILKRSTGKVTTDDEALERIGQREPILRPLVQCIADLRSLGVFLSTFIEAGLDKDSRLRCSYNVAGTETFRLSSSENAFGSGLNLQNIPKGDEGEMEKGRFAFPNIRTIFIPDRGFTFFSGDLSKADAQVVAWEADDDDLKQLFREGYDLHKENGKALKIDYAMAKRWVHATNYGGQARTMAIKCGITVHAAEQMRTRWFQMHPGILRWQERVGGQVRAKRFVQNIWGYRRNYFERADGLLPEALAWIGQSTVAIYINQIWYKVYHELSEVQVLLQVHDELAGQIPTNTGAAELHKLACLAAETVIPYDDPLVIPFKIKTSRISWGDCD